MVGTALVACTDTVPYVFSGISPIKMTSKKIAFPEPCLSRGAIFSTDSGVVYPSVNGLNRITEAGVPMNMTQAWITREKWNRYVPQRNLRASKNTSSYFCFSCTNGADVALAQTDFSLEISDAADKTSFSIWPQVGGHRIGFSTLTAPGQKNVDNVLTDPWNGVTELIYNGSIYYYDFTDQAPTIQPYLWRSKKFQGPHKDNFSAFRVFFDLPPGGPQTPPVNRTVVAPFNVDEFEATVTVTPLMTFKTGMLGIVRILADDKYIVEREIRNSEELMRIPSYARYSTWQLEVEGVVSVTNIKMATSVKELGVMK